jgi:hypothetical protein
MDPDFENTYTMYCGGGGDSDSGGNDGSSSSTDTGDMGSEAANNAATDSANASAGVGGGSSDTGDLGSEAANVGATQSASGSSSVTDTGDLGSLSENVAANLGALGTSSLGSGDTGPGGGPTDVGTSHTGDSTDVDPSDGITQYTETKSESLKAALDTYKAEQAVGLRPSNLTTTALSLVTGLPIGTLSMSLGVMSAYNSRRGNTTTSTTGTTSSTGTTGLLGDTTSDGNGGDSTDPIIYQTSTPLNNPADSAAIDFFANVKALDTQERYNLAKQKIAGITRPQAIDVQNSPYYNYLQKFNLNKGIL